MLILSCAAFGQNSPPPELVLRGAEEINTRAGKQMVYRLGVANRLQFPNEMFEVLSDTPACGRNQNSSRTWVEIYAANGSRIYGFCALKSAEELNTLAFQLPTGKAPETVYIILRDRKSGVEYQSNSVELK